MRNYLHKLYKENCIREHKIGPNDSTMLGIVGIIKNLT